ncbi:MAG TPA: 2-oxo-4-hydroxy-4-carboxy-5-ureidoimidazoline decarboxylase [Aestuariivirga sp.]
MNLAEANAAGASAFADIAEHSSWVAEVAFKHAPFKNREDMIQRFAAAVMAANRPEQLALLNAHPDLATRAKLTEDSTKEQMGVGLGSLSAAEFAHFTKLNEAYRAKNGFPFIFAVKGATKNQILAGFESRIENNTAKEFETALEQVSRIIRFRLEERVAA